MPGILHPSNLSLASQPKFVFQVSSLISLKRCSTVSRWRSSKSVGQVVNCSTSSEQPEAAGGGGGFKDALSNIVDKRVEELLGKEENRALLDKLNKASERVELARKEMAEIQRQEMEAQLMRNHINQLEIRASEIAECQKEVLEARAMVEEAERSLSISSKEKSNEKINRDDDYEEERWESVKAASIAALVGTLAGLPIRLTQVTSGPQLLLQLGITFASCALFGVTFRYAVRRDLDNIQLKTGTAAAFAFVKGLATLNGGPPLEINSASLLSHAMDGAFFVSQDLFIFIFAAVSLDLCFKTRVVSPFPIRQSD